MLHRISTIFPFPFHFLSECSKRSLRIWEDKQMPDSGGSGGAVCKIDEGWDLSGMISCLIIHRGPVPDSLFYWVIFSQTVTWMSRNVLHHVLTEKDRLHPLKSGTTIIQKGIPIGYIPCLRVALSWSCPRLPWRPMNSGLLCRVKWW